LLIKIIALYAVFIGLTTNNECTPCLNNITIAMTADMIILHKHKASWTHYQISTSKSPRFEGSASSFSQTLISCLGLNGYLANQEMGVGGCTISWCLTMTCAVNLLSLWLILSPDMVKVLYVAMSPCLFDLIYCFPSGISHSSLLESYKKHTQQNQTKKNTKAIKVH